MRRHNPNSKAAERRRQQLLRDPSLRLCYGYCTDEDLNEFYTRLRELSFTRPGQPVPAAPTPSGTRAAAG